MPYMINVGGTGNPLTYRLNGTQSFHIESIVANVDTSASLATGSVTCDVILRDDAGLLIARSRSSASLITPAVALLPSYLNVVTYAPNLPDTLELGLQNADLAITTGLTDTVLPPGGSVTVQSADAASIVRGFGMWVEDALDAPGAVRAETDQFGPWAYVPGPGA